MRSIDPTVVVVLAWLLKGAVHRVEHTRDRRVGQEVG